MKGKIGFFSLPISHPCCDSVPLGLTLAAIDSAAASLIRAAQTDTHMRLRERKWGRANGREGGKGRCHKELFQCCCLDERTHYLFLGDKHWIINDGEVIQIMHFVSSRTRYLQHVLYIRFTFQSDLSVIFKTGKSFLKLIVPCLCCMYIFDKCKVYFKVNSSFGIGC